MRTLVVSPRPQPRVDTEYRPRHSLGDTVFLDISLQRRNDEGGKMRCRFMFLRETIERYHREFTPRDTTAESYQRRSLPNGTIPYRFIHFSYRHRKQYISRNFASFPTYVQCRSYFHTASLAAIKWALRSCFEGQRASRRNKFT